MFSISYLTKQYKPMGTSSGVLMYPISGQSFVKASEKNMTILVCHI